MRQGAIVNNSLTLHYDIFIKCLAIRDIMYYMIMSAKYNLHTASSADPAPDRHPRYNSVLYYMFYVYISLFCLYIIASYCDM